MKNSISPVAISLLFLLQMASVHAQKYANGEKVFFCKELNNIWVEATVVQYHASMKEYQIQFAFNCQSGGGSGGDFLKEELLFSSSDDRWKKEVCAVCDPFIKSTGNINTPPALPPLPAGAVNLALNKTTFKFCHATTSENDPKKVTDGNDNTHFETDGGATPHHFHYLELDLGEEYAVNRIMLKSDAAQEDLYVIVSKTQLPKSHTAEELKKLGSGYYHISLLANDKPALPMFNATGRYVLLVKKLKNDGGNGTARLRLSEVEVWGRENEPFDASIHQANSPKMIAYPNSDGSLDVAWQDQKTGKIKLSHYNSNYQIGWKKDVPGALNLLGGFTKDKNSGGSFFIFSAKRESADPSEKDWRPGIVSLTKLNADGTQAWVKDIGTMDYSKVNEKDDAGTQIFNPLIAGSARIAYGNGKVWVYLAKNGAWDPSPQWGGVRHQMTTWRSINASNGSYAGAGWQNWHDFDQRLFFDGKDFISMDLCDRGSIWVSKRPTDGRRVGIFSYKDGQPCVAKLGDIKKGDNGYAALFAGAKNYDQSPAYGNKFNLALVHVVNDFDVQATEITKKDSVYLAATADQPNFRHELIDMFVTSKIVNTKTENSAATGDEISSANSKGLVRRTGIAWLTDYPANESVVNPKFVQLSADQYVAIWEKHNDDNGYQSTWAMVVNEFGVVVKPAQEIQTGQLNPHDDAFQLGGKAAWITGDAQNNRFRLFTLDENLKLTERQLDL